MPRRYAPRNDDLISASLTVCLLIATLFVDAFIGANLRWFVGGLFVLSMFSLSGGIGCFLRELHIAMLSLRIGAPINIV